MKKVVVIKTDGNNKIGLGHIYRSLSLAKELKKNNIKVIFLTESIILQKIIPKSFQIEIIRNNTKDLKNILNSLNPKIIIIDKLKENTNVLEIFKKQSTVIAIDYTAKNKKMIKNGINILYQKSGVKGKNSFSGFNLVILSNYIKKIKPIKISKKVKKIMIIQGGSDTMCNIPTIIDSLNQIDTDIQLNVIIGGAFECWRKLEKSIENSIHKIKIHSNIKEIGKTMVKNDIAITGGGMTSLELCNLGIPSIILCGEEFENETSSLLEKNGFGINLGYKKKISKKEIALTVKKLMSNYQQGKNMNKIGKKLIDNEGIKRVTDIVLREDI